MLHEGEIVRCFYKTGVYVGEIVELREADKPAVVKILSVLKHPLQGDLHHPKQTEVPLFHERPALSLYEKANIPQSQIKKYENEVPSYSDSLKEAVSRYEDELTKDSSSYAKASLEALKSVKETYRTRY